MAFWCLVFYVLVDMDTSQRITDCDYARLIIIDLLFRSMSYVARYLSI